MVYNANKVYTKYIHPYRIIQYNLTVLNIMKKISKYSYKISEYE